MASRAEIEAVAKVIRQRCCRAADGCDISEPQSIEIAKAALRAADNVIRKNTLEQQERLDDWHN